MSRFVVVFTLFVLAPLLVGENWPRFRGPSGQGYSLETDLPMQWSETEGVAWKTVIPGNGWSSPVVWDGRVVVTSTTDSDRSCRVLCLDAESGEMLWNTEVFRQTPQRKESRNSYATPTPVVNEDGVFVVFGNGSIAGLDWSGVVLWVNDEVKFYSRRGLGASPMLVDSFSLLVMPFDGSQRVGKAGDWPNNSRAEKVGWQIPWDKSFVLAVNLADGKTAWRAQRGMSRIAHVTPMTTEVNGKLQLLSPAGDVIQGFDPKDGRRLWSVYSQGEGVTPSFAVGDGLMFTASGFEKTTLRTVRLEGDGESVLPRVAWESRKGVPSESSLLYVSPYLYAVTSGGIVTCYEGRSGEIVWQERIHGKHCASPVYAKGRIYFLSDDGTTTVIRTGNRFEVLAENKLPGRFQASMAVSGGRLFLRSDEALFCVR